MNMKEKTRDKIKTNELEKNREKVIEIRDISIKFNMTEEGIDTLKSYVIRLIQRKLFYKEFVALQGVNLDVYKGDILGIIGFNGAGKSTLLKVLAQVLEPDTGTVKVSGRIAPLIELGAGFDGELTAAENIFLNGAMLGYSRKFIESKFDEIIEFAELRNFMNMPIKNFSSGMYARLGFAIATAVEADILIVDEILSVGDFKFQEKCMAKIQESIKKGVTIIFVSHSIGQIESLCNKVLWLEHGKVKAFGDTKAICDEYKNG